MNPLALGQHLYNTPFFEPATYVHPRPALVPAPRLAIALAGIMDAITFQRPGLFLLVPASALVVRRGGDESEVASISQLGAKLSDVGLSPAVVVRQQNGIRPGKSGRGRRCLSWVWLVEDV